MAMITALFKALGDILSEEFRTILMKAIGLTLVLFIAVFVAVQILVAALVNFSWAWADWALGIGTGLVMTVAFFFLMAPVTAAFAGIYLDDAAARVERRHYPSDKPGVPLPALTAILTGLQFALLVLAVNLAVLPTVLFGIGAVALVAANAYLLSREYFEMVAMRHMPRAEARALRRANAVAVTTAGLVPAVLALVPLVNLLVPLFATAFFTHIFKKAMASSV